MEKGKTRSIYCTESEYKRVKIALKIIGAYDIYGSSLVDLNLKYDKSYYSKANFDKALHFLSCILNGTEPVPHD